MSSQQVIVSVLADTKRFTTAMNNLGDTTGFNKLAAGAKKVGKAVAVATVAVGVMTVAWAAESVKSLARIEQIAAQTDAALKSTGGAAGRTRDQIDALAGSIEDMSGVEAESVTQGQNLLLTFTNIKGTNFDRATSTMTDMAVALNKGNIVGVDMSATATQLGKALNDPVKGITALSKVGVTFTEDQKKMIKTMVETGDAAGAQTVILDELAKEFGGSAAAAGETTIGKWERVKHAFGTLGETIFAKLLPIVSNFTSFLLKDGVAGFNAFAGFVEDKVVPALTGFAAVVSAKVMPIVHEVAGGFQAMVAAFKAGGDDVTSNGFAGVMERIGLAARATFDYVKTTAIPALKDFGGWVADNKDWLISLGVAVTTAVVGFQAYVKVMAVWRAAQAVATTAAALFNAVMAANPIGLIVLAIAALVAGLVWFFTQTETGKAIVVTAWAAIQSAMAVVVDWWQTTVAPVITTVWTAITTAATVAADWYTTNVAPVFTAFGELMAAVFDKVALVITWLWTNVWKPTIDVIVAYWSLLWSLVETAWMAVGPVLIANITGAWRMFSGIISGVWSVIAGIFTGVWNQIKITVETVLGVIKGVIKTATALIKGDWSGAWNALKDTFATIWNGITASLSNYIATIAATIGNVKNTITGAFSNAGTWLKDAGKAVIQGFIDGISNMFGSVKDKLGGLTNKLTSWKGPPKRDKILLRGAGHQVIGGFIDGLQDRFRNVKHKLGALTDDLARTDMGTVRLNGGVALAIDSVAIPSTLAPASSLSAAAAMATPAPVINVYALTDGPEVGRRVNDALQSFYRMSGAR